MSESAVMNQAVDLSGQVALVTGATAGLGWRFARVLAAAGAAVAITGRRQQRLDELKALIEADGGRCIALTLDVTQADELTTIVGRVEQQLGLVRILVNNAGIPDAQLAMKMSVEFIDQLLNTNVRAPFVLAAEVAKRLKAEGQPGRIVNLSSVAANHAASPGSSLYSTSKAAVARMTECLALEWSRYHINVNAIAPGFIKSEMSDGMMERIGHEFWRDFPRARIGLPEYLDSTLLYLCSPASQGVTGTIVRVDDGQGPF